VIAALFLIGFALGVIVERIVGARRRGRALAWTGLAVVVVVLGVAVGGYLWAKSVFDRIDKVDVSAELTDGPGTNYLLVGADNATVAGEQGRQGVEGARSDTIMVLRIEGGTAKMLSLNRDLWVANPATGQNGRLNAAYRQGPANLIKAVTENFGIPIDRYIEIDFASFAGLVDSFGGIDIAFAHPAFDLASGLDVQQSGLVHLDGTQALAYVRSRHYAERIDGKVVLDPTSDLGRVKRQQAFLKAIMAKAGAKRNPFTLMSAAKNMSNGLRIDDDMTMLEAARFAWDMGRLDPVSVELPVTGRTTSGGAAVLDLDQPAANQVLDQFR
jgi:LCP family protein required for cell wall assembly